MMLPKSFGLLFIILLLGACSGEPETGIEDVRWDRDACVRCRMVLSDPHFAAQIRFFPEGKRSRVEKFDDIGCAVLWLDGQPWKDDAATEIWVADHRDGSWIDARSATYVHKNTTPMEYGLGAQPETAEHGLNYAQAVQHVYEVEKKFNVHGQQLKLRLREQEKLREAQQ